MESVLEAQSLGFIRNLVHRVTGGLLSDSEIIEEHRAYNLRERFMAETGIWTPVNDYRRENGT